MFLFQHDPQLSKIGSGAFKDCVKLELIDLSPCSKLISIEYEAFSGCINVLYINLSENLVNIGFSAFKSVILIKSINLPASVTKLGSSCFYESQQLKQFNITSNSQLTTIESDAFYNTSISELFIPDTVKVLKNLGRPVNLKFNDNPNFHKEDGLVYNNTEDTIYLYDASFNQKDLILKNTIKTINTYCFYRCYIIESVIIPESVTKIDDTAFFFCLNLKYVNFPNYLSSIGDHAFAATSLTNLTLFNVDYIGSQPFASSNIVSVNILNVSTMDNMALSSMQNLTIVNISNIGHIKYYRFLHNCENLETIVDFRCANYSASNNVLYDLRKNVWIKCTPKSKITEIETDCSIIGQQAFEDKHNLVRIVLKNIREIYPNAFSSCSALTTVKISETLDSVMSNAFINCPNACFYVENHNKLIIEKLIATGISKIKFDCHKLSAEMKNYQLKRFVFFAISASTTLFHLLILVLLNQK